MAARLPPIAARWPLVDWPMIHVEKPPMSAAATSWILSEGFAGLQAQALGLAEAAGLHPELRVLAPRAPWKWLAASLWPAPLAAVPGRGAGAAARTGDRLWRCRGGGRRRVAPWRPQGGAGAASAHGPSAVRSDRGEPPRRPDRTQCRGDAHRAAPGHPGAAGGGGAALAATLRAPEAPAGRGAGRWQQRAVPPGRRGGARAGRPARRDGAPRRRRRRRDPLAAHRSGGDARAGRRRWRRSADTSGTAAATIRISACSRWPTRSSSRWTASR